MFKRSLGILLTSAFAIIGNEAFAQCAMCKAANEDNAGSAEGFNAAILFLMATPYVIAFVAVVFFVVYWKKRKKLQA